MRKLIGLLAVVAVAVCALAGIASATSNYPNGTAVTATNSGNIALSGVVTCGSSSVSGTLTNATLGATISVDMVTYSSCNTPVASCSVTPALAGWTINTTSGGPTVWSGTISSVCINLSSLGCQYTGTLSGGTWDESTDTLTLAGSLSRSSGGFICPSSGTVSGKYLTTPTDLDLS